MKEYLSPGDLHLPPRSQSTAHRGHDRLHDPPRPQVEPHQRLQLPPPGGGGHAHPGTGLRPGHRHRRPRRRAPLGQDRPLGAPGRGRSDLVLRERRHPFRGGDLQGAGLHPSVGPDLPRALRGAGPQAPPLPLRRPGELARAHRGPAREQRAPDRPRGPRGHPVAPRPGPGPAAAGLERGPRPPPSLGPAVVAADPADPGPRDRPPRVRRHLRRVHGDRGQDGRDGRRGLDRAHRCPRPGRGLRGRRRAEAAPGGEPGRAGPPHRDGRAPGGGGQLLHRDGAVTPGRPASTGPPPS